MGIRELVEGFEGRLTPADRRLIQVLLARPGEGGFLSSIELAERAKVHPTTVVRLARKLGFSGYADLRRAFREEAVADSGADRMRKRLAKMADGSILRSLIESEIHALQSVPEHITQEQMEAAADTLIGSRQVFVYGVGHASALADLLARRLNRSGYRARALHHIDWETPEMVMTSGPDTVVVAFAFRHIPPGLSGLLTFVMQEGAKTIVVSDLIGPALRPQPDVLLAASRGREGDSQSLTVPMAICNALILELSKRDDGQSVGSLQRLVEVRQSLSESTEKLVPEPTRSAPRKRRQDPKK